MANTYDLGDLVRASGVFTDSDDADQDPTVVVCKYRTPAAMTTTLTYGTDDEVVKDSTGHYHVDISLTASGDWYYRWESTGTGQAAEEERIIVESSKF